MKTYLVNIIFLTLFISSQAYCEPINARSIMKRVDDEARATTNDAYSVIKLTSCKFGLKKGKIKCVEKPRIKVFESVQTHVGKKKLDNKALLVIHKPTRERGFSMLSYTYDDLNIDNETWLYLSALGRIKRIAAGNSEDQSEPASLFGSEFTTEDLETGKLDEYTYSLLESTEYSGRPVWIIESTPTESKARRSLYTKSISWIDQERFVPLKTSTYDYRGNEVKRYQYGKIEKINDVWLARYTTVLNLASGRLSNFDIKEITFELDIDQQLLTQRALSDKGFREQNLARIKAQK